MDSQALRGTVSKQHKTTAAQMTATSIFTLKTLFSQKTTRELHKATVPPKAVITKN